MALDRLLIDQGYTLHPTDRAANVRQALRAAHPDTGGDDETFRKVMRAKELIGS